MPTIEEKQAGAARQQDLFRQINERIREIVGSEPFEGNEFEILCECADHSCSMTLPVSVVAYDEVRSNGTHFINAPGHVLGAVEWVVKASEHYVVVEKFGEGGRMAVYLATGIRGPAPRE